MEPVSTGRAARARRLAAALVLTLAVAASGGGAAGQAPPPPPGALDRAETLIRERAWDEAAAILRDLLAAEPGNRRAREMLAFVLEARGDLEGEGQVRASLARDFPDDPRVQADYGRVLERAGKDAAALAAYRRARALRADAPDKEITAAIDRMDGRTSVEVGIPVTTMSDPDADATRAQAGAAVPLGAHGHVALLAARTDAESAHGPAATQTDLLAASLVLRHPSGASLMVGPRLHAVAPEDGRSGDRALGGAIAGRSPLGPWLEADVTGEIDAPWEEAAVSVLHGGRSTGAQGHLYAHLWSRRLLVQVGGLRRRLSIAAADPEAADRPEATQSLVLAGADFVVWRKQGGAVRGDILDDTLVAPTALPTALVLGYRHYEVTNKPSPEFSSFIGLVPRGSVDEISGTFSLSSPRGRFGAELRGGIGRDTERDARLSRAGGSLVWSPTTATRFVLGYDEATDFVTGLEGRRHAATLSLHVDL